MPPTPSRLVATCMLAAAALTAALAVSTMPVLAADNGSHPHGFTSPTGCSTAWRG